MDKYGLIPNIDASNLVVLDKLELITITTILKWPVLNISGHASERDKTDPLLTDIEFLESKLEITDLLSTDLNLCHSERDKNGPFWADLK